MRFDIERLYKLLPAMYQLEDAKLTSGSTTPPLKSLISIIADEISAIEENLDQLYDDQFIETCAEWVVPYIGELVGARSPLRIPSVKYSQRAEVANTLSYRRRKGTASIIEQQARDITGWDASIVEFFQVLATTQYLNHLRLENTAASSLRNWRDLEYANTPFDKMPKSVDVRSISRNRGKYNIQNIGVYLWRINSYQVTNSQAFKFDNLRYTFNPLGLDISLFNMPVSEERITQLAGPDNVSRSIGRRTMLEDLTLHYGPDTGNEDENKVFIKLGNADIPIDRICICNLSDNNAGGWKFMPQTANKVAIDPILGRIAFAPNYQNALNQDNVFVWYNYGFPADIGGGSYDREHSFQKTGNLNVVFVPSQFSTIQDALNNLGLDGGIIEIVDNATYTDKINISIGPNKKLEIRAADGNRSVIHVNNDITIDGGTGSEVTLNGLLIDGANIVVDSNSNLELLRLLHCTIRPANLKNLIVIDKAKTRLQIQKSIISGIRINEGANAMIRDCIIDRVDKASFAYSDNSSNAGGALQISNCTVIGKVIARQLELANNTIFCSRIEVIQIQKGCIRFSYFPIDSITPSPYKCQPILSNQPEVVKPLFNSLKYGDSNYCQLNKYAVNEISEGADNGSEMGVFYHLFQPQKINHLKTKLNEYLRFGLEAGIFFAS